MKRFWKKALLFCITAVLLAGTAQANSAPWPSLTVKVVNGPEEPYYLDLLEQDYEGYRIKRDLSEQEDIDLQMLEALLAAIPEGWHGCLSQGSSAWMMVGYLTAPDGVHHFNADSIPREYRLVVVTQSGEVWLSEAARRNSMHSTAALDWSARTLKVQPTAVQYLLQMISTLVPTVLIEALLLLAFRFDWKKNWKPFLLVNLVTQGALALAAGILTVRTGPVLYMFLLPPIELAIALVEGKLYTKLLQGHSKGRAFAYGLTANAASALLGFFLVEPVWNWIVSMS